MKKKLLIMLTLAFVLFAVSCAKDEPDEQPIDDVTVKPSALTIEKGKTGEASVTAGSGKYIVASMNTEVATAKLEDVKITITAKEKGETRIIVTDTETKKTAEIAVTVFIPYPDVAVNQAELTIYTGTTAEVNITSGSGKYMVTSNRPEVAEVVLEEKKITVTAKEKGEAKVTVTDTETKKTAEIAVTVKPYNRITITTSKKKGEQLYVYLDFDKNDQENCWIDLNNNGFKDEGEEAKNDNYIVLPSPTISLYGNVTKCVSNTENLTAIDISNHTTVKDVEVIQNQITEVNASNCPALVKLWCQENLITKLDFSNSNALVELYCFKNKIEEIDVSSLASLKYLDINGNKEIKNLDVSKNPLLNTVVFSGNQIEKIDLSQNKELVYLYCEQNGMNEIDISNNKKLKIVWVQGNNLKKIDVTGNTEITSLLCFNNQLEELDVSTCKSIKYLRCYSNNISGEKMTKLVSSLPPKASWFDAGEFRVIHLSDPNEKNICTKEQAKIASTKFWDVFDANGESYPGS